jgi:hypothetical protein
MRSGYYLLMGADQRRGGFESLGKTFFGHLEDGAGDSIHDIE